MFFGFAHLEQNHLANKFEVFSQNTSSSQDLLKVNYDTDPIIVDVINKHQRTDTQRQQWIPTIILPRLSDSHICVLQVKLIAWVIRCHWPSSHITPPMRWLFNIIINANILTTLNYFEYLCVKDTNVFFSDWLVPWALNFWHSHVIFAGQWFCHPVYRCDGKPCA